MKKLIFSLAVASCFSANAAPLNDGLLGPGVAGIPLIDEVSMAILNTPSDASLIDLVDEVRSKTPQNPHYWGVYKIAMGSAGLNLDAWGVLQRRKEALAKTDEVIIPLQSLQVLNVNGSSDGRTNYWYFDRNITDFRTPGSVSAAGHMLACTIRFVGDRALEDQRRYCVELVGVAPEVNNPRGFWVPQANFEKIFSCGASCGSVQLGALAKDDQPVYAVIAKITDRKVKVLNDLSYVTATVQRGLIFESKTGAVVDLNIALKQRPGDPMPWEWTPDGMERMMRDANEAAKGARKERVATTQSATTERFEERKAQVKEWIRK